MGYVSESNNNKCGLPAVSAVSAVFVLTLMMALMGTAGVPAVAFAAYIDCGQCHGTKDNTIDPVTGATIVTTRALIPPETDTMPQVDNGIRGLHGIHMNYSSTTYGKQAGVASRGNCNYCHNSYGNHASGLVSFLDPNVRIVPNAGQPLLNNISGTNDGVHFKTLMVYTSAGRGTSYEGNIPSLATNPTGYCTKACHAGTSQTNQAPWGNYTTVSVKLSCNSCHADSTGVSGTERPLSGDHANHIVRFSADNNSCSFCHPDNTLEGKTATDTGNMVVVDPGSGKAYPHATDGTNVLASNVVANGNVGNGFIAFTFNGGAGTCSGVNCHSAGGSDGRLWSRTSNSPPSFTSKSITGTLLVGNTLTANAVTADADGDTITISYQWKANNVIIPGATSQTLLLTFGQAHKNITCALVASDIYGGMAYSATAAVTVANTAPVINGTPAITGQTGNSNTTWVVGDTLSVTGYTTSDADHDTVNLTYQWQSDGALTGPNTGATYIVQSGDTGNISCTIKANDGVYGGISAPATTAAVSH